MMGETKGKPQEGDPEIVCGCTDLTLGGLRHFLREDPNVTFEDLLSRTGAGGRCTACLLDLEYYFSTSGQQKNASATAAPQRSVRSGQPSSIKARIYSVIDSVAPLWPRRLYGLVPVLAGHGIEQWLAVANYSLLYDRRIVPPTLDITLRLRDADGRLVADQRHRVEPESSLRVNVSELILAASAKMPVDQLRIGSLEVCRRAAKSGFLGTTRPQIEILLPRSATTVHTQAAGFRRHGAFTTVYRPEDDRMFLTIVNAGSDKLPFRIECFGTNDANEFIRIGEQEVVVPARGTRLEELVIGLEFRDRLRGRVMRAVWKTQGEYKVHAISASPSLDRMSIDHM